MKNSQSNKLLLVRWIEKKLKNVLPVLGILLLAGCETPQRETPQKPAQPPVSTWPEVTIRASADKVRAAATQIMAERGYQFTPGAAGTLLFDRTADLGTSAKFGFVYGKEAWRRVRMTLRVTLTKAGAATLVTARPAVLINRGEPAFEREEVDTSEGAQKLLQFILEKIRDQAQGVQ